jgi:hypothetical protein
VRAGLPLALAAAGLLALACLGASPASGRGRSPAKPAPGPLGFETLVQRSIPGQTGDQLREVARDETSWKALWARLREGDGGALPAQPPAVDFEKDMVIAAALPTQGCVSKVTIRGVVRKPGELVVDLLEAPPAPNCVCFVSARPIHVVRLPRSAEPVRFEAERGVTTCGPRE